MSDPNTVRELAEKKILNEIIDKHYNTLGYDHDIVACKIAQAITAYVESVTADKQAEIEKLKSELESAKDNYRHADYTYDQKLAERQAEIDRLFHHYQPQINHLQTELAALKHALAEKQEEIDKLNQDGVNRQFQREIAEQRRIIAALRKRVEEAGEIMVGIDNISNIEDESDCQESYLCVCCSNIFPNHFDNCLKLRARRWLEEEKK